MAAVFFPGISFACIVALSMMCFSMASTLGIPVVAYPWCGILWTASYWLVNLGAQVGYRQPAITFPPRRRSIKVRLPLLPPRMTMVPVSVLGCVLTFVTVAKELYYVLYSTWEGYFYADFGWLAISAINLMLAHAFISFLVIALEVHIDDYRMWWKSMQNALATSMVFCAYCLFWGYASDFNGGFTALLYCGFTIYWSFCLFLMLGAVGVGTVLLSLLAAFHYLSKPEGSDESSETELLLI